MKQKFQLEDPQDAREFLREFPLKLRKRGEELFRRQAVEKIEVEEPGAAFRIRVKGGAIYHVNLFHDRFVGWDAECDCPCEFGPCKHAYAAMTALLQYAGVEAGSGRRSGPEKAVKKQADESVLRDRFAAAKGRPLLKKEEKFLSQINALYHEFIPAGLDPCFQQLRSLLTGKFADYWSPLNLWCEPPPDDHEFWLYLVNFAREQGLQFPDFMQRVSDLGPLEEQINRLKRWRLVSQWQEVIGQVQLADYSVADALEPVVKADLRLRLEKDGASLELKEPPRTEFRRVMQSELYTLGQRIDRGELPINDRSEVLWGLLKHRMYGNYNLRLKYDNAEACRTLYRVFDSEALREMAVTATGIPLEWSRHPLRWQLSDTAGGADNSYQLSLVHEDGAPLGHLDFALTGSPSYFIVDGALHPGPPFDPARLNPREELRLPAEIVEHQDGLALLHRIGTPLPEKLAERVQTVDLHPRVTCRLERGYQEECFINIDAVDPDGGEVERWFNRRWEPVPAEPSPAEEGKVRIFNRRRLACVPAILDGLNTMPEWQGKFRMVIIRKFPERFADWLDSLPPEIELRLGPELAGLRDPAIKASVSLDAEETDIDWFDLRVDLDIEDTDLTKEEIKLLLAAKGKWVRLDRKGWRRLEFDVSAEDDEQLARLGLNPRDMTGEPQRLHALQLASPAAKKFLPDEQCEQLTRRAEEIQARVTPEVPAAINAELRPYQVDGFHFLAYLSANHFGGILADDMGLGKTLQTLTWLMWLRAQEKPGPSLVVCPKSVMDNWQAESERFAGGLRTRVWQRGEADHLPDNTHMADLHVINYNQLRKLGESLHAVRFQAVILDEGQHIKNPSSQTAQAARGLKAGHRLVLTGTPIENQLLDLWSLMTFAMPGVLGSRSQFGKLYNAKDDPFARLRLSSRVRPFLIRRTKAQVAQDLPDRIEEDLYCEIEGEQKKLYQAERKRAQQILLGIKTQQQLNELRFNFLTSLLHLRQICCHPRLFHETTRAKSAKLEALLEQLGPIMAEGGKVLIFSQFVQLLELVESELISLGYTHWKLTGSTENRGQLVASFQKHDGAGVFLISLKAGGSGLNLTAASYVVLFDPWWNPAVENQAIDRTHRIGQTSKVIAYRLLIKNSIEEKIRELQKQKQALATDVLGEEKFSAALSLSDFQYLLSD